MGVAAAGGRVDAMRALLTQDLRICINWDLVLAERAALTALLHLPALAGAHAEVLFVFFSLAHRLGAAAADLAPFFPRVRSPPEVSA